MKGKTGLKIHIQQCTFPFFAIHNSAFFWYDAQGLSEWIQARSQLSHWVQVEKTGRARDWGFKDPLRREQQCLGTVEYCQCLNYLNSWTCENPFCCHYLCKLSVLLTIFVHIFISGQRGCDTLQKQMSSIFHLVWYKLATQSAIQGQLVLSGLEIKAGRTAPDWMRNFILAFRVSIPFHHFKMTHFYKQTPQSHSHFPPWSYLSFFDQLRKQCGVRHSIFVHFGNNAGFLWKYPGCHIAL